MIASGESGEAVDGGREGRRVGVEGRASGVRSRGVAERSAESVPRRVKGVSREKEVWWGRGRSCRLEKEQIGVGKGRVGGEIVGDWGAGDRWGGGGWAG